MNLRANYSKRIRLSLAFSIVAMTVCAQSIWNAEHLEQVKKSLNQPAYSATYQNLLKQADKALNAHHLSVMMKDKTPPSGDKHDYLSQARYFWPDPTTVTLISAVMVCPIRNWINWTVTAWEKWQIMSLHLHLRGISVAKNSMH